MFRGIKIHPFWQQSRGEAGGGGAVISIEVRGADPAPDDTAGKSGDDEHFALHSLGRVIAAWFAAKHWRK
jgi:hypothetical protein